MKLVLDNGTEIPFENIKILDVNEKQRIVVNLGELMEQEDFDQTYTVLSDFFKPAKMILVTGDITVRGIEAMDAIH